MDDFYEVTVLVPAVYKIKAKNSHDAAGRAKESVEQMVGQYKVKPVLHSVVKEVEYLPSVA